MNASIPHRGAASNPDGRFETLKREQFHDGWDWDDDPAPAPATSVGVDASRSIITRNDSPDIPFDRSVNPYRGCEHGCAYCFARPGHSYLGLSPGLDFETKLFAKPDAAKLLDKELRKRGYAAAPMAFGTNTDPYQPIEKKWRIMRDCLQVLSDFNHPVSIVTKGALVLRDLDLLADMAKRNLVHVAVSLTTLDRDLCRKLEPRAAVPAMRLRMIEGLAKAGVPVAAMAAPIIPRVNDHELEDLLKAAAKAGAQAAATILLRLPHEVKDVFAQWLEQHMPLRAAHVLSLLRQSRNGALNQSDFGARMRGTGEHAELLSRRLHAARKRFGLSESLPALESRRFRAPLSTFSQPSLFD